MVRDVWKATAVPSVSRSKAWGGEGKFAGTAAAEEGSKKAGPGNNYKRVPLSSARPRVGHATGIHWLLVPLLLPLHDSPTRRGKSRFCFQKLSLSLIRSQKVFSVGREFEIEHVLPHRQRACRRPPWLPEGQTGPSPSSLGKHGPQTSCA